MNFKDPVSTFAYNLISLHHDIMWYIIIILTLVYWALYKILKDYSWNVFNKQEGFLLSFLNNRRLIRVQKLIFYFWLTFFIYNIVYFSVKIDFAFASKLDKILHRKHNNKKWTKFLAFMLGKSYYTVMEYDYLEQIKNLSWDNYNILILERFSASFLFNKSANAVFYYDGTDSILSTLKFQHSINLEYVFGLFPTVIISLIIVPSMYLLYSNESDIHPCITVKIVGHQWYWSYESASKNVCKKTQKVIILEYNYESVIVNETDLIKGRRRLLETDTSLVLPYNIVIRFLISSADVLHAWAVPEMGIKVDAVPGRLNQVVTMPSNIGVFYGQCSEICGVSHGFMPIKINVISLSNYYNLLLNKNTEE